MAKASTSSNELNKPKIKRGIHSKSKTSKNKGAKNYKKAYGGQGR
jgi:hypothetical protein